MSRTDGRLNGPALTTVMVLAACLTLAVALRSSASRFDEPRGATARSPRVGALEVRAGASHRIGPVDLTAVTEPERSAASDGRVSANDWGDWIPVREEHHGSVSVLFVREDSGLPVPRVRCLIQHGGMGIPRKRVVAFSDDLAGRATFAKVVAGQVEVSSRYSETVSYSLAPDRDLVVRIRVPAELATFEGRVLDPRGFPCAGAEIMMFYPGRSRTVDVPGRSRTVDVIGVSDALGVFRIPDCPNRICVGARRSGFAASIMRLLTDWKPDSTEVLQLREARTLSCFVGDAEGRPVADAEILVDPEPMAAVRDAHGQRFGLAPPSPGVRTDAHGGAYFSELDREAAHVLVVRAPGYGLFVQNLSRDASAMRVTLEAEARCEGLVVDHGGNAVQGARVTWGIAKVHGTSIAYTDVSGRFRLQHIPRSPGPLALRIQKRGLIPTTAALRPSDPRSLNVIRMERL